MKNLKKMVSILGAIALIIPNFGNFQSIALEDNINYATALQKSLYFYDANMCGDSVSKNSLLNWRDNCHITDCNVQTNYGDLDLSGGFHDAGDNVKFGLTQAYTLSMLGLGYYNFSDGYYQTGQSAHIENISTYFADYLKKCTVLDDDNKVIAFCYQVGDGEIDHDYWGSPENQSSERPVLFATAENPCTDIVANTSGALALYSINFGDSKSLDYAKSLYEFAKNNDKSVATIGCEEYYPTNSYLDDLSWASACLYKATGEISYLNDCKEYLNQANDDYLYSGWCPDWSDVWLLTATLIEDWEVVKNTLDDLITNKSYQTPQGYCYFSEWGSARYNCNTQLIGLIYDKYNNTDNYTTWAKSQMDYILGNNDDNICYMVGYNENSVKYPHHCASSGLTDFPNDNDTTPQKYVLVGALVGGAGANDEHYDTTDNYQFNEVAIDYNASFTGALSALYLKYGGNHSIESKIVGTDVYLGDIDCNSKISFMDLLILKTYLLGIDDLDKHSASYLNANVNGKDNINLLDLVALKKMLLN